MTAKEEVLKIYPGASAFLWRNMYRIVRPKTDHDKTNVATIPLTGLYGTEAEAWSQAALNLLKEQS